MGNVFKKRHQTSQNIDKKRILLLEELNDVELPIEAFYDISPIAFNGCKVQKKRRKKKKTINKRRIKCS